MNLEYMKVSHFEISKKKKKKNCHDILIFLDAPVSSEATAIHFVLPAFAFLALKVPIAANLNFMNHQGPHFQLKIFTVLQQTESHLHLEWPDGEQLILIMGELYL